MIQMASKVNGTGVGGQKERLMRNTVREYQGGVEGGGPQ